MNIQKTGDANLLRQNMIVDMWRGGTWGRGLVRKQCDKGCSNQQVEQCLMPTHSSPKAKASISIVSQVCMQLNSLLTYSSNLFACFSTMKLHTYSLLTASQSGFDYILCTVRIRLLSCEPPFKYSQSASKEAALGSNLAYG